MKLSSIAPAVLAAVVATAPACEFRRPTGGYQIIVGDPVRNSQDEIGTFALNVSAEEYYGTDNEEIRRAVIDRKNSVLAEHKLAPEVFTLKVLDSGQVVRMIDERICPERQNPKCEKVSPDADVAAIIAERKAELGRSLGDLDRMETN